MPIHALLHLMMNRSRWIGTVLSVGAMLACSSVSLAEPVDDALAAYNRGDYATALRLLRPLAEEGNATAQFGLGSMYEGGRGVPQNDAEATKWWRKAADQGDDDAQYNLGLMYHYGRGVPRNSAEAMKWLHKAADQNHAPAQYNLGVMYRDGLGVPQNYAEAMKWFRKAADRNHASAQRNLGIMYRDGLGVPKNDAEAATWFSKAAEQNHAAMKTFVLLVTWIVHDQPPSSYQTTFNSAEACEAARNEVLAEGRRLKAEWQQRGAAALGQGAAGLFSASAPAVTAVCAAQ